MNRRSTPLSPSPFPAPPFSYNPKLLYYPPTPPNQSETMHSLILLSIFSTLLLPITAFTSIHRIKHWPRNRCTTAACLISSANNNSTNLDIPLNQTTTNLEHTAVNGTDYPPIKDGGDFYSVTQWEHCQKVCNPTPYACTETTVRILSHSRALYLNLNFLSIYPYANNNSRSCTY
jgi:hypothetical protein